MGRPGMAVAECTNSPCNPTGATYDRKTLEGIAAVALRHDLLIISDEIYEKVLYDGLTHVSIATLGPEVAARTVIINGVSKAYAMTGWRIGYAAGPKDLLTAMANIQSQSTSNPCSISQKAAVAALRFEVAGRHVPLTVSIGLATAGAESFADLLRRADHAMYAAKHAGRNRVELAPEPVAPPPE